MGKAPSADALRKIMDAPVLELKTLTSPVMVSSIELLQEGKNYLVRARSTDGVEAITVPNPAIMVKAYPVFLGSVVSNFVKKDARQIENLQWEAYRAGSNYKMQGQL